MRKKNEAVDLGAGKVKEAELNRRMVYRHREVLM
jgi:hypothetical protein